MWAWSGPWPPAAAAWGVTDMTVLGQLAAAAIDACVLAVIIAGAAAILRAGFRGRR